jgi:transposase
VDSRALCGLLNGSLGPTDEVRSYVRQGARILELAEPQVSFMHKALVRINLRLDLVFSDIEAAAIRPKIIKAIIEGTRDPKILAQFRDSHCKSPVSEIEKALEGNYRQSMYLP